MNCKQILQKCPLSANPMHTERVKQRGQRKQSQRALQTTTSKTKYKFFPDVERGWSIRQHLLDITVERGDTD